MRVHRAGRQRSSVASTRHHFNWALPRSPTQRRLAWTLFAARFPADSSFSPRLRAVLRTRWTPTAPRTCEPHAAVTAEVIDVARAWRSTWVGPKHG